MTSQKETVRLRVSPEVARIVAKGAPREVQLDAARGGIPLPPADRVTSLFFLFHAGDPEIKDHAAVTLKKLSAAMLAPVLTGSDCHPRLLAWVASLRLDDPEVMRPLLAHPGVGADTLLHVAAHGRERVVSLLLGISQRLGEIPGISQALANNPQVDPSLRSRLLAVLTPPSAPARPGQADSEAPAEPAAGEGMEDGEESPPEEELNLSKYQQSLEMGVSEKIKMALTGDKEWRNIFIRDANKLVSSAVLKNPRITEGEILAVAKNRSSSDELIRLITLNREWVKNYEIKKTLIMHPRTPLPMALRYMQVLTEKDLKLLAKSRSVSSVVVNNARRILIAKEKKGR